jgi:hypothetical protein
MLIVIYPISDPTFNSSVNKNISKVNYLLEHLSVCFIKREEKSTTVRAKVNYQFHNKPNCRHKTHGLMHTCMCTEFRRGNTHPILLHSNRFSIDLHINRLSMNYNNESQWQQSTRQLDNVWRSKWRELQNKIGIRHVNQCISIMS